jgi:hypothetical protein
LITRIAIEKMRAGGEGVIKKNFPEIDCGLELHLVLIFDGGCCPHTPNKDTCRRPRRGAPAADQKHLLTQPPCPARPRRGGRATHEGGGWNHKPEGKGDKTLPGFERFSADFCEMDPAKKNDAKRGANKMRLNRMNIVRIFVFVYTGLPKRVAQVKNASELTPRPAPSLKTPSLLHS